ncbi:MAG: hypothetical protein R3318_05370 [Gammaproteobacteria bacterium]|nr:hypothetical protein [Gammaproteobacteria bacterium]
MHYVVKASLNNGIPQLSVIDLATGRVRLCWRLEKIQEMFDRGEILQEEFLQPEKYGMKLLLRNLFLIACAQELETGHTLRPATRITKSANYTNWLFKPVIGTMKQETCHERR